MRSNTFKNGIFRQHCIIENINRRLFIFIWTTERSKQLKDKVRLVMRDQTNVEAAKIDLSRASLYWDLNFSAVTGADKDREPGLVFFFINKNPKNRIFIQKTELFLIHICKRIYVSLQRRSSYGNLRTHVTISLFTDRSHISYSAAQCMHFIAVLFKHFLFFIIFVCFKTSAINSF